jgi:hypothetical protein
LTVSSAGNTTLTGNLTVSGTGTSSFGGVVQVSNTLAAKETNASLTLQPGPGTGGINYAFGQGTGDHVFYGGTTERMRLGYGGNLLIGTAIDGGQKLQVYGDYIQQDWGSTGTNRGLIRFGKHTTYANIASISLMLDALVCLAVVRTTLTFRLNRAEALLSARTEPPPP